MMHTGVVADMLKIGFLAILLLGASPRQPRDQMLGLVSLRSGKTSLEINNFSLPPETFVRLVSPSDERAGFVARTGAKRAVSDEGLQLYDLAIEGKPTLPAIAVVGFHGQFQKQGKWWWADLYGDGRREFFRSCTSSEGLHFTVWSGQPLTGTLLWHQYHYLGYDVEPNCSPAEFADVKR